MRKHLIIALERTADGDIVINMDSKDVESLQSIELIIETDIPLVQPFIHKGCLIPVENGNYKCPWCVRIFGNKRAIRRRLATPTDICHKRKYTSDSPQCAMCMTHFSHKGNLNRHIKS